MNRSLKNAQGMALLMALVMMAIASSLAIAIWYNNQNQAQHRNFGDALELRLFNAPIVKVSNAENLDISQLESDPFDSPDNFLTSVPNLGWGL